jgi:hypothetical protein
MKEFFENCLRDLEPLTGKRQVYYWQIETDTDSGGKAKGARKFEVCVQGMVIQSQNFPYIPESDQKRIINEMMVKDQKYDALNSSVIYKWLAMYKDKYFMSANAPQPEPIHQHTPEELERIDKLANEFKAQLAVAFQPSFKGIEKDMDVIKREDLARVENKAFSAKRKQNDEYVFLQEKKMAAAKSRGLDKLNFTDLKNFNIEGETIIARSQEEAQEIYLEVYV